VVTGGFASVVQGDKTVFGQTATNDTRFFDLLTSKFTAPSVDATGLPRAGLGASKLLNDCILLVGGVDTPFDGLDFNGKTPSLVADVFCPSMACPEGLWKSVCFQDQD